MTDHDWYRKTTWTKKDKADYFERFNRSRSDQSKVQYLHIQALYLINTQKASLARPALELLKLALQFKNEGFMPLIYYEMADAYKIIGDKKQIIESFRTAVYWEKYGHSMGTEAGKEYATYIVENSLGEYYDEALDAMEHRQKDLLPIYDEYFVYHAVRAIIFDRRGEKDQVPAELNEAIKYFSLKKDIFVRHPGVGMIDPERRKKLINLVKKLAKKHNISIGS